MSNINDGVYRIVRKFAMALLSIRATLLLKNNHTLLVNKMLGMFIKNKQPSLIEPVL